MNAPRDPFSLDGKVAVVTGGYGVLGGSLASGLAAAGARVAILGRRREIAEQKVDDLRRSGADAMVLVADALDETQLDAARDELLAAWGRIDILVNAAGGNVARSRSDARPIFEVPSDAFDEVLRLNLHGTVTPSMRFGEVMGRQRSGVILNISSMAATRALSGVLGYSIAKAGIDSFTRWLAVEMARKYGDGVRVNAIAPAFTATRQTQERLDDPAFWSALRNRLALERAAYPEDVARAALFLASPDAAYITGVVLPVDGGTTASVGTPRPITGASP